MFSAGTWQTDWRLCFVAFGSRLVVRHMRYKIDTFSLKNSSLVLLAYYIRTRSNIDYLHSHFRGLNFFLINGFDDGRRDMAFAVRVFLRKIRTPTMGDRK